MTTRPALAFKRFGPAEAHAARDEVEMIYRDSYMDAIERDDPFNSPDVFMRRFDVYTGNPLFDLVVAYVDGEPAGQSWGWPLPQETSWWEGLDAEPEPGFTREDSRRTFALSEIMVRRELAGRGVAHALHDELLSARPEQRATLLVEPDNTTAYRAYSSWGWRQVARLRPSWPDAPLFDVLTLTLPLNAERSGTQNH